MKGAPINPPSPGGLARLWREGMKGRGWKKEIPKQLNYYRAGKSNGSTRIRKYYS